MEPSYSVQSFERGLSGIQSSKPRRGSLWLLTFNWSRVPVPQHANGCLILFNYRFVFVSDFHVCVLTRSQDRDHFQFVTFFHKSVNRSLVISRGRLRPSEFQHSTFISGSWSDLQTLWWVNPGTIFLEYGSIHVRSDFSFSNRRTILAHRQKMQSDRRAIPFLSFSPNHSPTLAQSTNLNPPTPTTYSYRPDSQQPPYYSPRYPTDTTPQHTADGQPQGMYYRYPAETSQSAPVGYPESSQRTMLHDGPFPDDYDLSVGSSELGVVTRRERLGNSGEHRLFLRRRSTPQMADQMTLNSSTGLYCLMPIPSDEQSLPNRRRTYTTDRQPVENNSFYHDEISTDIDSLQFENDDSPTLPTPTPLPSLAHENSPDLNPMILTFQMHPNYQGDRDNPETQSFVFLSGDLNEDSRKLYEPKDDPDYILNLAMQTQPPSPIPMRNSSGWSQPSLSSALDAHADLATEQSNSPARTTPESESSASIHHSGLYSNSNPDTQCSSSTPPTSSSSNPSKKKKSKMHQCELCPKKFPRWVPPSSSLNNSVRLM